jgi:uncharacterized membrane protein YdjX (TVP38/TMEM64 family)
MGVMALALAYFLFFTETGTQFRDPAAVRNIVAAHPRQVLIGFLLVYTVLSVLLLPVWWLQIVAGFSFGLLHGVALCTVGAAIGATATLAVSKWIAADWFRATIEPKIAKLHELRGKLGSNGLLIVMAVRLLHMVPFGISNYAFGMIGLKPRDVALGTALGGIPALAFYVSMGAGLHPWSNLRLMAALTAINIFLLLPVLLAFLLMRRRAARCKAPTTQSSPAIQPAAER